MNAEIIQGSFESDEALDIITRLFHVLIKHHENNLLKLEGEEIHSTEEKIKLLQKELFKASNYIILKGKVIDIRLNLTISQ